MSVSVSATVPPSYVCSMRRVNEPEDVQFRPTANRAILFTRNEMRDSTAQVYHFSPLCNHTPASIEGIGDRRGKKWSILHNFGAMGSGFLG
jgi:hypothetical protein